MGEETNPDWIVSDSIKLTIVTLQLAFTTLCLLSPMKQVSKTRIQQMQATYCLVSVVYYLGRHGIAYRSWETICTLSSILFLLTGYSAIYISDRVRFVYTSIMTDKEACCWRALYPALMALLLLVQIGGTVLLLATDAHHAIAVLRHATVVVVIAVLGSFMVSRLIKVQDYMREIEANKQKLTRGVNSSPMGNHVNQLQFLTRFAAVAFIFTLGTVAVLIHHTIKDSDEGPHTYSSEYNEDIVEYEFLEDLEEYLNLFLVTFFIYYARVDVCWWRKKRSRDDTLNGNLIDGSDEKAEFEDSQDRDSRNSRMSDFSQFHPYGSSSESELAMRMTNTPAANQPVSANSGSRSGGAEFAFGGMGDAPSTDAVVEG